MARDLRQYLSGSQRTGIFDTFRNLGSRELLNDIGGGSVREGLNSLAKISDSVRSGRSVVPGQAGNLLNNSLLSRFANTAIENTEVGANAVLETMGISRSQLDAVNSLDPNVANRALGSAKQIFQQIKQGDFDLNDIPNLFSSFEALEQQVRAMFDVEQSSDGILDQFGTIKQDLPHPSPWAVDLVHKAPRYKFLYFIDIKFAPAYQQWNATFDPNSCFGTDDNFANDIALITKQCSRPRVDVEYQEVNMYNYWTRIPKRISFPSMSMKFIDDGTNSALKFYTAYMRAMSPITNLNFIDSRTGNYGSEHTVHHRYENNSMYFKATTSGNNQTRTLDDLQNQNGDLSRTTFKQYAASLGPLTDDVNGNPTKSLLSSISLYHMGQYGQTITAFHMFNPKITTLQPDDLDMADNGNGNEFSFEFIYDSLFVDPGIPIEDFGKQRIEHLSGASKGALYYHNLTKSEIPTDKKGLDGQTWVDPGSISPDAARRIQANV